MTLSMYRIRQNNRDLALFATFSTVNGLYTSKWLLSSQCDTVSCANRRLV